MEYARKEGGDEALLNLDNPQGANGGDSARVLRYVKSRAEQGGFDTDLLLFNCGLHDIKKDPATGDLQVPLEEYRRNLESIVELVEGMSCSLVWIRTTPFDETEHNIRSQSKGFVRMTADGDAYNTVADDVMTRAGIPMIDLHAFTRNLGDDLYLDHVHFTEPVREKQAAFIADWLMAQPATT